MFSHYGSAWAFQYDNLDDLHPDDRRLVNTIVGEGE
jgi:hypothetical protein